ncbi:hypothetical protein TWF481_010244 [Arthrobotrys musiformis]|uniref:tRNA(Ile)-lysidine synthetase n=1 Tax=Arthrobotrys musiformis TaxID=47236 RepID=A0AAV9W680_9PEZI
MAGALKPLQQVLLQSGPLAATEFATLLRGVLEQAYTARREAVEIPKTIGIAVSGGIDSMALAHLAHKLSSFTNEFQGTDFRAMVVNHGLRHGSREEAEDVVGSLERLGLSASLLTIPSGAFVNKPHSKTESIARRERYRLFARACQEHGISHLITAHHANDQAETVLMRLCSGSGNAGLAGMSAVANGLPECEDIFGADGIVVLRPFLGVFKNRLRETLTAERIQWHEDPTNADVGLTPRNAIRALLTPPPKPPPKSKSKSKSKPPPAVVPPTLLPEALNTPSLLRFSQTMSAANAKTEELVDWYLSRCILRHVQPSNLIEAFIPLILLSMPVKLLTRVLARIAGVISPMDRVDLVQMSKVAKNILESTDPHSDKYSYVNHANDINTTKLHDSSGSDPPKKVKKDFRPAYGKANYFGGAITGNNIFWEAVHCRPMSGRKEGVLLSCFRQPYIRKSATRSTDTPELELVETEPLDKWHLFDGRFWLRYTGPPGEAFWTRIASGRVRRVFITGTRKEVMYRAETEGVAYDNTTDLSSKQMLHKLKTRFKSEAPGKSKSVLPVLCEEDWRPTKQWKVPYRVLGFPTFGIGGEMMGQWEWKVKKRFVVGGVVIGDRPVTVSGNIPSMKPK